MTHRLLLVEDEANYRQVFGLMIADLDVELLEAGDGEAALEILAAEDIDLVVTDLNMPRLDGMALLKQLQTQPQPPPVVVVTAYGTVDSAVEAMRNGAIDYLTKPFDEQRLHLTLRRAFRVLDLMAENRRLRGTLEETHDFSQILGESSALVEALQLAARIAASDSTVLVRGESGTGKELVARAIHFNGSRSAQPFVAVNCAALPDTLLEAELFGAEAGAYTGATRKRKGRVELASGGTLFLDEIGDMPLPLQAKLLRLIQEKTFTPLGGEAEQSADVRFVCATNLNLEQAVSEGRFREDLFYRIAVLPVTLPPLRERGADILLLAEEFIARACQSMGRKSMQLTVAARSALTTYSFPGNVRELANLIERAVILTDGGELDVSDLNLTRAVTAVGVVAVAAPTGEIVLPEDGIALEQVERSLIEQALERAGGNKTRAAKLLGLSRATLRYRIDKLGL